MQFDTAGQTVGTEEGPMPPSGRRMEDQEYLMTTSRNQD